MKMILILLALAGCTSAGPGDGGQFRASLHGSTTAAAGVVLSR